MSFHSDKFMFWEPKEIEEKKLKEFCENAKKKYIQSFLSKVKGKKLLLYPVGGLTEFILKNIDLSNFELIGLGDKHKCGSFQGYPIYKLEDIKKLNVNVILVCSFSYYIEIRKEIFNELKDKTLEILTLDKNIVEKAELEFSANLINSKLSDLNLNKKNIENLKIDVDIIFISYNQLAFQSFRYAAGLKDLYNFNLALLHLGKLSDEARNFMQNVFCEVIEVESYDQLINTFVSNNKKIFHVNLSCWLLNILYLLLESKEQQKVIWDVYDFLFFDTSHFKDAKEIYSLHFKYDKFVLENVDAIVYQDCPFGFKKFISSKYQIDVPVLHFNSFVLEEFCLPLKRQFNINGNIHINYAGNIDEYCIQCCKQIAQSGCDVYLFTNPYLKSNFENLLSIDNFYFNPGVYPPELQTEIKKSDYAFLMHNQDKNLQSKFSFSQRIIVYLEAGVPMITSYNWEYMKKLVQENKVGVVLKNNDYEITKEILLNLDIEEFIVNIEKMREKLSLRKNLYKLKNLYEKVMD